jgi:hypothetical protein
MKLSNKLALIGILSLVISAAGCLSLGSKPSIISPSSGKVPCFISQAALPANTFAVVSLPMSTEERAQDNALETAAAYIAMKERLYVFTGRVEESAGRYITAVDDYSYSFNVESVPKIKERLKVVQKTPMTENQFFFLIKDPTLPSAARLSKYGFASKELGHTEKKPAWIAKPPKADGYYTGVGLVQSHRYLADGVFGADIAAAQQIVTQVNSTVRNYSFMKDNEAGSRSTTFQQDGNIQLAEGTLRDFEVIDRWIDPKTMYIYSLAVSRK